MTAENPKTSAFLRSLPLFSHLSDATLQALTNDLSRKTFAKGDVIMREGESDGHLCIVEQGAVEVTKRPTAGPAAQAGNDVKLVSLGVGETFGLGSLVDNIAHSATVRASAPGDTQVLTLSKAMFDRLVTACPEMTLALLKASLQELRMFRSRLVNVGSVAEAEDRISVRAFDFKGYERPLFEAHMAELAKEFAVTVHYVPAKLSLETVSLTKGDTIVVVFVNDTVDAAVLTALRQNGVEMIALRCAGFNNVDLAKARELGISVARVPAYSPYAVAEHAASLLMCLNRKLPVAYNRARTGNFSLNNLVGFDLHGKTVGVIGTGKIGQCFIKIMQGFGCNILCYDAYPSKDVATWAQCRYVDLDTLLAESHVISLHCPLLESTFHLINAATLAKMRRGVILINTSRGALINTPDLIKGLKSKHVGAAGLDVYEEERNYFYEDRSGDVLGDDVLARLMTFNNVIVTSHQAFLTTEALEAISSTTAGNIREFLSGKRMGELTNSCNSESNK